MNHWDCISPDPSPISTPRGRGWKPVRTSHCLEAGDDRSHKKTAILLPGFSQHSGQNDSCLFGPLAWITRAELLGSQNRGWHGVFALSGPPPRPTAANSEAWAHFTPPIHALCSPLANDCQGQAPTICSRHKLLPAFTVTSFQMYIFSFSFLVLEHII